MGHPRANLARTWNWDLSLAERLEAMYQAGFILLPGEASVALPTYKQYLADSRGLPVQDLWTFQPHTSGVLYGSDEGIDEDVRWLSPYDRERLGYPTQKPEALLGRIIEASSNRGDLVLDPFCGCGTATVAAHRLDRQWIGLDITYLAVDLMRRRLVDTFPADFPDGVHEDGAPHDEAGVRALAEQSPLQFQYWAVGKLDGTQTGGKLPRRGADRGIDGRCTFPERDPDNPERPTLEHKQVIISVKGGQNAGVRDVRDLRGTIEREDAPIGVIVLARQPTKPGSTEPATRFGCRDTQTGAPLKLG